ncbi:MAG: OmpA family protein [Elusimicrobiota bacterium]
MKRNLLLVFLVLPMSLFLTACPKKPKKPVVVPKQEVVKEPAKPAEEVPEPTIQGTEFQSIPEIKSVYFDYDKYDITEDSRKTLESDAEFLRRKPSLEVLVEGNTCECGTNEYNLGLGQKRAQSVREYLIKLGVPGQNIATIAYGEEKPVNKNVGPPDSTLCVPNRRAEVKVRRISEKTIPSEISK